VKNEFNLKPSFPSALILPFLVFYVIFERGRNVWYNTSHLENLLYIYVYSMKVRIVKKKTIEDFAFQNASSRNSFRLWLTSIKMADWNRPKNITETFGSADLLGNGSDRVVFDIGGNNFRMICKYHFGETRVHLYVKWIGTHAEYTQICKDNKQYSINSY
jgi:mRNA interferase HigB